MSIMKKIEDEDLDLVNTRTHWVRISLSEKLGSEEKLRLYWEVPWRLRIKYNWYFKYRAALLQVQNPKLYVEMTWGNFDNLSVEERTAIDKRNKIIAKKRKITEFENKIELAKNTWDELFPIEEDKMYKLAVEKLSRLKTELILLHHVS